MELFLATDVVVADRFAADAKTKVVSVQNIPDGWMGLDIGPETIATLQKGLANCRTVIWNGPMGGGCVDLILPLSSFDLTHYLYN